MNSDHHPLRTLLADDLTGALDTGVQSVAGSDLPVHCIWRKDQIPHVPVQSILMVDTESRNLSESDAVKVVSDFVSLLSEHGRSVDFKKIDSTLRGHVSAELNAVLDLDDEKHGVLVCPALPGQDRIVEDGLLYVDGVPLAKTDLAKDPLSPVHTSRIADLLKDISMPVKFHAAGDQPPEPPEKDMLHVCDAQTMDDLRKWAAYAMWNSLLPVGSAGLAAAWPTDSRQQTKMADPPQWKSTGPVVIVCGTPAIRTREQVAYLRTHQPDLLYLHPERKSLLADGNDPGRIKTVSRLCTQVRHAIGDGRNVLVDFVHLSKNEILQQEGSQAMARTHAQRILNAMSALAPALDQAGLIILLGGDTARTMLDASGAYSIELLGEALPQIPSAAVSGGQWDKRRILTKAGGFGSEDALVRLLSASV